ncbi:hypothetical protein [Stygiolobus caldivivus]|uniref:hypothetical protein n=1 Tax=Stygiolobus caldivivus TaxID=2824673 RepID=UPI001C860453|nr:hypothetical protein [Stygiolobus caldivivus]
MYVIRESSSEGKPRSHYYRLTQNKESFKVFRASLSISELDEVLLSRTDIKFNKTRKTISTDSERLFKMAIIYGGVRQTIRVANRSRLVSIAKVLLSLEEFSLQFWYTEFVSRYSTRNNIVDTYKVGRSFRDLYEL